MNKEFSIYTEVSQKILGIKRKNTERIFLFV
jgi:hypothetical protein